jgi:peroxiredoxin
MRIAIKFLIFLILLSIDFVYAQTPLNLKGTVNNVSSGKIYLQKFNNKMFDTIDSTTIENGKFSFKTSVTLPEIYGLTLDLNGNTSLLFLENNEINVLIDTAKTTKKMVVTGSTLHDLYLDYKKKKEEHITLFIKKHPKSLVAAYLLYREWSYRLTPDEIEQNIALLDRSLDNTPYIQVLKNLVIVLRSVAPGNRAIDFELPDTEGELVKLSSRFGKYLLLEFWASWCPDCRKENPNVVKAYNKYKSKGFDIFAVSLDKNKASWLKGIKDDNLTWTHVSDLGLWNNKAAKLYGVRFIPGNVLIDPNGVIIARDLFGDDLEKKLEEIYISK